MKEDTKTWLLAIGAAAIVAFAGLVYHLYPGIVAKTGLGLNDLGGGAVAALILWLVLGKQQPMTKQGRLVLGAAVATRLLVGLAVARLYTPANDDPADLEQEIRLQWWRALAEFDEQAAANFKLAGKRTRKRTMIIIVLLLSLLLAGIVLFRLAALR
jgi:hypothetical protein